MLRPAVISLELKCFSLSSLKTIHKGVFHIYDLSILPQNYGKIYGLKVSGGIIVISPVIKFSSLLLLSDTFENEKSVVFTAS